MMAQEKLAERVPEYWVVDVEDPRDTEKNMPGYRRRFVFDGLDAAQDAWTCWADAERAGFLAKAERAKRV